MPVWRVKNEIDTPEKTIINQSKAKIDSGFREVWISTITLQNSHYLYNGKTRNFLESFKNQNTGILNVMHVPYFFV